jgi:hypothetical protein
MDAALAPMKWRVDQKHKALIVSTWCHEGAAKVMINVTKNGVDSSIVIPMSELVELEAFIGDVLDEMEGVAQ